MISARPPYRLAFCPRREAESVPLPNQQKFLANGISNEFAPETLIHQPIKIGADLFVLRKEDAAMDKKLSEAAREVARARKQLV